MYVVIELSGSVCYLRDAEAGEEVIVPDLDIGAVLVAGSGETWQTSTRRGSAAHQRLGEPDVERYS